MEDNEVPVELTLTQMPDPGTVEEAGLRVGLQEKHSVVQDVPADSDRPTFRFTLRIGDRQSGGAAPNALGAYAHGPRGARFVYVCWGTRTGTSDWETSRRAKIPLAALTWPQIEQAQRTGKPIRVCVVASDARGRPICATVPSDYITWER